MKIVHDEEPDFIFSKGNTHGIIFESSASTGKPKVTLYGRDEWDTYIKLLASHHWKNGLLQENDRVTNLCASPYISFRIVHDVIENFPGKISEIPLGCDFEYEYIYKVIEKYRSNVLTAINSTFLGLANYLIENGIVNTSIRRLLGGGELLFGSQVDMIKKAFPNARLVSFMYGTTESGPFAYSDLNDELNTFNVFDTACIVEILDKKTDKPITNLNEIGKCVVTSLARVAAPAIRMDTGDNVCWIYDEKSNQKKLKLIDRRFPFQHTFAKIEFSESNVLEMISKISLCLDITQLQVVINDNQIDIVLSLLNEAKKDIAKISKIVINGFIDSVPGSQSFLENIKCRVESYRFFSNNSKRKARLILDKRINQK